MPLAKAICERNATGSAGSEREVNGAAISSWSIVRIFQRGAESHEEDKPVYDASSPAEIKAWVE